jgi:hypothetical protein
VLDSNISKSEWTGKLSVIPQSSSPLARKRCPKVRFHLVPIVVSFGSGLLPSNVGHLCSWLRPNSFTQSGPVRPSLANRLDRAGLENRFPPDTESLTRFAEESNTTSQQEVNGVCVAKEHDPSIHGSWLEGTSGSVERT